MNTKMNKPLKFKFFLVWVYILFLFWSFTCWSYGDFYYNNKNNNSINSIPSGDKFLRKSLKNGVKILVQEKPGTGLVSAEIIIKTGLMQEMDTVAGITNITQNMLLQEKINDIPLNRWMEDDGCLLSVIAREDYARISLLAPRDSFRVNFKRIIQVLKNPQFKEENLEKIKKKEINYIESSASAMQSINEIFLQNFYRFHPYRQPVYGYKKTVERLTVDDIKEYYGKYYTGNRITVSVVGDVVGMDILDLCDKLLLDIPRRDSDNVDIPWEAVAQEKKIFLMTGSNIAWIYVGFPAPGIKSPDYPTMRIIESMLGEGLSCRLFIELREKEGLAYELASQYPQLEGPSYMILYVVTTPEKIGKSRKKLFQEIRRIKTDLVSPEELQSTKRKVLGKFLLDRETNSSRAFQSAFFTSMGLNYDYDSHIQAKIQNVTPEDIRHTARKYLDNQTLLIIQPNPPSPFDL